MTALRWIANGRTLKGEVASDGWSRRDLKRLEGMQSNGLNIGVMSKILRRPVKDIRAKLAEF